MKTKENLNWLWRYGWPERVGIKWRKIEMLFNFEFFRSTINILMEKFEI